MKTVLLDGLDGEGPGDIVGAITHQAEISGDLIGDIEIEDGSARVEIDANVADLVVEKMDGNSVGRSEVSATMLDGETADDREQITDYVERYQELVELEREEEMRQHEQEIEHLSGKEREAKGRAILHMRGRDEGEGLGGYLVKFLRQRKGEELPDLEISVGDLVMASKQDPLRGDNPTGTVTEKTNYSLTVAFDEKPPGFVYGKGLRLDLYVNDIT
ncbi:MAG: DbpA RNA binding domain-containing protein, partial [Candidatus Nanohaloarchaea archaeon]|nr:DbpA RNA binding domain-containing protein [Candidatus Nanohaloarchaea archaeon]